jgi:DNA-binding CsgD family transcriptional regulator
VNARRLRPSARPGRVLSRKEARVLALTAAGYKRNEVAELLGVGTETVKSQRASLIKKLNARNVAHAVAIAYTCGFAPLDMRNHVADYVVARETRLAKSNSDEAAFARSEDA